MLKMLKTLRTWRERKSLIASILPLLMDGRKAEREIDKGFGNVLTQSRMIDVPQEHKILNEARDFITKLSESQDRLERMTLGAPPWENHKFSIEADYWDHCNPRWFEIDLLVGKLIWNYRSVRWIRRQERKRLRHPACLKQGIGTLTRLERSWLSYRQQQVAMLKNLDNLPYTFPLLDAIKEIEAIEENVYIPPERPTWQTAIKDRNREIQKARVELEMAEGHIALFAGEEIPMCLEGTSITRGWKHRCRKARQLALAPECDEYIAFCHQLVDDIAKAFQYRTTFYGIEARLIQAVQAMKLIKKRYPKFHPAKAELKSIDKLLSIEAPEAWLDNDWDRLKIISTEQGQKLAKFSESMRAWLRVNQIPIDEELEEALKPLPMLVTVERTREARKGYIQAGKLGTQVDPSVKAAWEND